MNAPITFDTLAFVRRLEASGVASGHAEALADALREIVFDTTATSADVREAEMRLRGEVQAGDANAREAETRLLGKVQAVDVKPRELALRLGHDLTVRLGGMIAASTALTVAILGAVISLH